MDAKLSMGTVLPGTIADVRPAVEEALKGEGFGVLTEIDVEATLRTKIGVELGPYLILGACNPSLAHRALSLYPSIGLLLPCNVVLRAVPTGVEVSFIDPEAMFSVVPDTVRGEMEPIVQDARAGLRKALETLG